MSDQLFDTPDAKLLSDIERLQLAARQAAHGALAGMHRSLRKGSSIEFSEHQLYTPGDDIRHIDWRAYGKTDRYHVKQYEDETNLRLELVIDHSGSMRFGTTKSKLEYARTLAAALSYLALRQGDSVGMFTFSEHSTDKLPARATSTHLIEVLTRLTALKAAGKASIAQNLDRFAQSSRRRSVVVILSDLFDPDPDLLPAILRIAARKHDVAVFHLLDNVEVNFSYENPATFECLEDARRLFVHPRVMKHAFVSEMQKFLENTSRTLNSAGIDYQRVTIDQPVTLVLGSFLRSRESRHTQRQTR
jgi:uncharacterized protein (DUF58 family)